MIKCPYCKSGNHAVIGHDDTGSIVSYYRNGEEITGISVMRLCMDCGVVYVAKKEIDAMRQEMEATLKNE